MASSSGRTAQQTFRSTAVNSTILLSSRPASPSPIRTDHSPTAVGSTINAYGAQVTWAQVNVDGVTMVNNRHAYVNVYPSIDAIQEFKVLTGNPEAEYGGGAGTITNIQLKTGGNALHGDVFEFLRNTAMDARNYFIVAPVPKQVLKQNQFGATLGGPDH